MHMIIWPQTKTGEGKQTFLKACPFFSKINSTFSPNSAGSFLPHNQTSDLKNTSDSTIFCQSWGGWSLSGDNEEEIRALLLWAGWSVMLLCRIKMVWVKDKIKDYIGSQAFNVKYFSLRCNLFFIFLHWLYPPLCD